MLTRRDLAITFALAPLLAPLRALATLLPAPCLLATGWAMLDRNRHLSAKVTILLDGRDVTRLCRDFSASAVRLYLEDERGKKVIRWDHACGDWAVPMEVRRGAVQVLWKETGLPVDPRDIRWSAA